MADWKKPKAEGEESQVEVVEIRAWSQASSGASIVPVAIVTDTSG